MAVRYERVLTLQKVPQGGFSYINSSQGISLNSGQQFFIDSVYTGFFPPVSRLSTDPNKYRKQKWLSAGLEGNSFRRYINENQKLQGIPSGLEPGNFVYFTIEPKSSLLEQGAGSTASNLRYISTLKAKPYMVVENDANRDNSYEKTPSSLFTGVSGNNNFVKFHPQSAYKNLALQSLRFHPIIGHGYARYDLYSGRQLSIQPKNHHLETFIEVSIKSGQRINYGNSSRILYTQDRFKSIASGRALYVEGATEFQANGIYVANNQAPAPSYYINENNYRIYNSGATNVWVLSQPKNEGISYTIAPDLINFNTLYRTSGITSSPHIFRRYGDIRTAVENPTAGWYSLTDTSKNIYVSRMVSSYYSTINGLYILSNAGRWGTFDYLDRSVTGAYLSPRIGTFDLPYAKINKYSKYITDAKAFSYDSSAIRIPNNLRYFTPNFIFDNQDLIYAPFTTNSLDLPNEIITKERINFKRPTSSNLHQAKKVNVKFIFNRDDRSQQQQRIIKNIWPVQEKVYDGYTRTVECYDEKDSDTYSSRPFYIISGKDYAFEQNELFVYNTRPDFNNPDKQNVVKW